MPELISGAGQAFQQVGQIELVARTRRSEDAVAQGHQQRMDHDLGGEGGRLAGQSGDVTGLRMEDLHARVEMAHVGVGHVDERLDLRVDRSDDVGRYEIVDDDCAILPERVYDLGGRCISLNSWKSTDARA